MGYTHITVNCSKEFLNPKNQTCTNRIEMTRDTLKFQCPDMGCIKVSTPGIWLNSCG